MIHEYTSEIIQNPTCTTDGIATYTCECDEKSDITEIAAIGHSYDSGKITKAATCTVAGVKTYTCEVCGATKTETVKATGHSYKSTVVAPTYSASGYTIHKCSKCGNSYSDTIKAKKTLSKTKITTFASSATKVKLSWKKVANADGYRVYRYNPTTKKYVTVATVKSGNKLSYTNSKLKAGTKYIYKVKAYVKENGTTCWSSASAAFTAATKPAAVKFTKTATSKTAVRLTWKKTACTGYTLQQYNAKTKKWVSVKNIAAATTTYKISGLTKNTTYKFRIRAYLTVPTGKTYSAWSATATVKTAK